MKAVTSLLVASFLTLVLCQHQEGTRKDSSNRRYFSGYPSSPGTPSQPVNYRSNGNYNGNSYGYPPSRYPSSVGHKNYPPTAQNQPIAIQQRPKQQTPSTHGRLPPPGMLSHPQQQYQQPHAPPRLPSGPPQLPPVPPVPQTVTKITFTTAPAPPTYIRVPASYAAQLLGNPEGSKPEEASHVADNKESQWIPNPYTGNPSNPGGNATSADFSSQISKASSYTSIPNRPSSSVQPTKESQSLPYNPSKPYNGNNAETTHEKHESQSQHSPSTSYQPTTQSPDAPTPAPVSGSPSDFSPLVYAAPASAPQPPTNSNPSLISAPTSSSFVLPDPLSQLPPSAEPATSVLSVPQSESTRDQHSSPVFPESPSPKYDTTPHKATEFSTSKSTDTHKSHPQSNDSSSPQSSTNANEPPTDKSPESESSVITQPIHSSFQPTSVYYSTSTVNSQLPAHSPTIPTRTKQYAPRGRFSNRRRTTTTPTPSTLLPAIPTPSIPSDFSYDSESYPSRSHPSYSAPTHLESSPTPNGLPPAYTDDPSFVPSHFGSQPTYDGESPYQSVSLYNREASQGASAVPNSFNIGSTYGTASTHEPLYSESSSAAAAATAHASLYSSPPSFSPSNGGGSQGQAEEQAYDHSETAHASDVISGSPYPPPDSFGLSSHTSLKSSHSTARPSVLRSFHSLDSNSHSVASPYKHYSHVTAYGNGHNQEKGMAHEEREREKIENSKNDHIEKVIETVLEEGNGKGNHHYKSNASNAKITKFHQTANGDSYEYETSNGIRVQEQTEVVDQHHAASSNVETVSHPGGSIVKKGVFMWVAPDGKNFRVRYIANEVGFHSNGDHSTNAAAYNPVQQPELMPVVKQTLDRAIETTEPSVPLIPIRYESIATAQEQISDVSNQEHSSSSQINENLPTTSPASAVVPRRRRRKSTVRPKTSSN